MKFGKRLEAEIATHQAWTQQQFVNYKMLKKIIKMIINLRADDPNTGFNKMFVDALKKEVLKASKAYEEATRNLTLSIDNLSWKNPNNSGGKQEAKAKLDHLEEFTRLNRTAVRKIIKKFKKKTNFDLPIPDDLSSYSIGSDSEITILSQRLQAFTERGIDQKTGGNTLASHFGAKELASPQKLHILVELTRMRKLLVSALEWAGTPAAQTTKSPLLMGNIARHNPPRIESISYRQAQVKQEKKNASDAYAAKPTMKVTKISKRSRSDSDCSLGFLVPAKPKRTRRKDRQKMPLNSSNLLHEDNKSNISVACAPAHHSTSQTVGETQQSQILGVITPPVNNSPGQMLSVQIPELAPSPFQTSCPIGAEIGRLWNLEGEDEDEDALEGGLPPSWTASAGADKSILRIGAKVSTSGSKKETGATSISKLIFSGNSEV